MLCCDPCWHDFLRRSGGPTFSCETVGVLRGKVTHRPRNVEPTAKPVAHNCQNLLFDEAFFVAISRAKWLTGKRLRRRDSQIQNSGCLTAQPAPTRWQHVRHAARAEVTRAAGRLFNVR
jgi:hypothetical protein